MSIKKHSRESYLFWSTVTANASFGISMLFAVVYPIPIDIQNQYAPFGLTMFVGGVSIILTLTSLAGLFLAFRAPRI